MRARAYFDYVAGSIGGPVQPNASAQVLAEAELRVPSVPTAHAFLNAVGQCSVRMASNSNDPMTLTAARDTLLPQLLSGNA